MPLSAMTPPYGKRQTIILRGDPEWSIHAPGQYIDVGRTYLCATVLLHLVAGSAFPGTTPAESAFEIADDLLQVRLTIVDPLTSVLNAIVQGHVLHTWATEDYRKDDTILSYFTAVSGSSS
jgi:hypothetical protein